MLLNIIGNKIIIYEVCFLKSDVNFFLKSMFVININSIFKIQ